MKCLNCGEELVQIPKKREKQFCDSTCRSNYWQKKKRLVEPKKEKVVLNDFTKPKIIKPFEQPKTNFSIDTTKKHKLWQEGDAAEGTTAFFLKYGVFTYDEIEN